MSKMAELAAVHDTVTQLVTTERADAGTLILACNEETDLDTLAEASDAVDAFWERAKELRAMRDDVFRQRIETHGKFVLGGKLWRLVERSKVKCRGWLKTFPAIAEACGGDEEAIDRVMKDDGFYISEARTRLGERFDEFFETVKESKLDRVDEPGPRQLQGIPVHLLK